MSSARSPIKASTGRGRRMTWPCYEDGGRSSWDRCSGQTRSEQATWKKTGVETRNRWTKMGCPFVIDFAAEKNKVDGCTLGGGCGNEKQRHGGKNQSAEGAHEEPVNVTKRKHRWEHHIGGVVCETIFAGWAGEGEDWVQKIRHEKVAKEDFVVTVLHGLKAAVSHEVKRHSEVLRKN